MAPIAIAVGLDQHRTLAFAAELRAAQHGVAHGQDIHAVDDFGVHLVVGEPRRAQRQAAHAGHLVVGAAGHAVMIVADQEDDRQAERLAVGVVIGELILGGEVQQFEHDAVGVRAVAGETAHHSLVAKIAAGQGRAGGDRHAAANDRVGAEMADGKIGDVHRAAASATIAVVLAEQLTDCAIGVLLERRLEQFLAAVRPAAGDPRSQLALAHQTQRDRALRQALAMPAVRAGDVVGDAQRRAGARRRSLLADRDMSRAAIVVVADRLVGAGTQLDDHLLEFAYRQHVFEKRYRLLGRQRLGLQLRPHASLVAIRRDPAAIDHKRFELRPHVAQIRR